MPVGYALAGLDRRAGGFMHRRGRRRACMSTFIAFSTSAICRKWAWVREMKKFHMAHHFHNENGNYGITNLWWDRMLGTFYVGAADRPKSATVFNLGYDEEVAKTYPYVAQLTPGWPHTANPVHRKRQMVSQQAG